jgi:dienelactone hydrolase
LDKLNFKSGKEKMKNFTLYTVPSILLGVLILFAAIFLTSETGHTRPYKSDIYYPSGEGPFPVIILSHGRGGPHSSYHKIAKEMVGQGYATIVLDHYSSRGDYGVKFRKFPNISEGKGWREEDILDLFDNLKDHTKINRKKVVLAGWSAGAGIVLPFISNPGALDLPEGVAVVGAILTYPYTYGCYKEIQSFNIPVLIHFGKLDGNKDNPLTGYYCWKEKVVKFSDNKVPVLFKAYDNTYHGFDLVALRNRPKRCRTVEYKGSTGELCMAFNESSFKQSMIANKRFLKIYLGD